jgi:hypothetical protein
MVPRKEFGQVDLDILNVLSCPCVGSSYESILPISWNELQFLINPQRIPRCPINPNSLNKIGKVKLFAYPSEDFQLFGWLQLFDLILDFFRAHPRFASSFRA